MDLQKSCLLFQECQELPLQKHTASRICLYISCTTAKTYGNLLHMSYQYALRYRFGFNLVKFFQEPPP
jgi:hypothetical protein